MLDALHNPLFRNALLTASALGAACALLSVVVVLRRWAFIGEGIGHSGFGGAGTAWLLALLFPAMDNDWLPYLVVVLFCLATALAIGAISRGGGLHADAAIGIFLVASLAWGFLAQQVYREVRHAAPPFLDTFLFGRLADFSGPYTAAAVTLSVAVVLILLVLWKEVMAYSFDPLLAATSGVRTGFIHYLLMLLIALEIVVGARVVGSVLVTALLVLPAATALLLTRRLGPVVLLALAVALSGAVGGSAVNLGWRYVPAGPAIVLIMFVEFLAAYAWSRWGANPG